MQLDGCGRAIGSRSAFDHVRVKRSLSQEFRVLNVFGFFFEAVDERVADLGAFLLRIRDSGQLGKEAVGSFDHMQIGFEVIGELIDHDLSLTFSQQSVIDQDTRKLRSYRFEQQRRDHRRVDPPRKTADHTVVAHLFANPFDRLVREIA